MKLLGFVTLIVLTYFITSVINNMLAGAITYGITSTGYALYLIVTEGRQSF